MEYTTLSKESKMGKQQKIYRVQSRSGAAGQEQRQTDEPVGARAGDQR